MITTTEINFDQAREISADEEATFAPFAALSDAGREKVRAFADAFYDGAFYDENAVFEHCEQAAECLLVGQNHIVELRRVNHGVFGGFKVDTLELMADDFDWLINAA